MSKKMRQLNTMDYADVKDAVIDKAVGDYTAGVIPPRPSAGVYDALERNRSRRAQGIRKRFTSFAAAAAVLAVTVFGVLMLRNFDGLPKGSAPSENHDSQVEQVSYSLSSLSRAIASDDEISAAHESPENDLISTLKRRLESENAADKLNGELRAQNVFYKDDRSEPYVISAEFVFATEAGQEKLIVIADLKKGLKEYAGLKGYAKGADFGFFTEYINGEYLTLACALGEDAYYYVSLTSPVDATVYNYLAV